MIRCVLGERKSGKSVYVENQVKEKDEKALYIATLPKLHIYQEIINIHQSRRPSTWECVELFQMSAEEILSFRYENYRNVILDNLSYYLWLRLYFYRNRFVQEYDERVIALFDRIAANNNTTIYFVDTPLHEEVVEDDNGFIRRVFTRIL